MTTHNQSLPVAALVSLALASGACSNNPSSPSFTPLTPTVLVVQGTLAAGASNYFPFALAETAAIHAQLISLAPTGTENLLSVPVKVGFGTPTDTECTLTVSATATPSLVGAVAPTVNPGSYCVFIGDLGNLPDSTDYVIRITESPIAAPDINPEPVTDRFSTDLGIGGTSSRAFNARIDGTVSLTLQAIGPPPSLQVGFALGVPRQDGTGCLVSKVVATGSGSSPQISMQVDRGSYCVRVADLGTMTAPTSFTVQIVRP
jgi:hypothetical protein